MLDCHCDLHLFFWLKESLLSKYEIERIQLIFILTSATIWFIDKVQDGWKTAMIDVKSDEVCTIKKEKHLYVHNLLFQKTSITVLFYQLHSFDRTG